MAETGITYNESVMLIALAGATGFTGKALVHHLAGQGHQLVILSRRPVTGMPPQARLVIWDPEKGTAPAEALDGVDAVIHLAGEPVSQRWSKAVKQRIRDSRVLGTANLVSGIAASHQKPKALICASASGYYGEGGARILDESAAPGSGFLPEVCREWEQAAEKAEELGVRVVRLRIGIVLGQGGGALAKMLPPFRAGLGGPLGSGEHWMSWIHLGDLVALIAFAAENPHLRGAVNAASPNPVTNAEFTRALARALRRPAIFAVPPFALRILFGEMSQILVASQRLTPRAAMEAGFKFEHPEIYAALKDIVG
jgi:hypothetical protein